MPGKHVFGKVRLTREEREPDRRIWEATKDEPSREELERRLGPGTRVTDPETVVFRLAVAHKVGVAREKAGLSHADLAERVGIDQETIARVESGARGMTIETLVKVANALGLRLTLDPVPKE